MYSEVSAILQATAAEKSCGFRQSDTEERDEEMCFSTPKRYEVRRRGTGAIILTTDNLGEAKAIAASDPTTWLWDTVEEFWVPGYD